MAHSPKLFPVLLPWPGFLSSPPRPTSVLGARWQRRWSKTPALAGGFSLLHLTEQYQERRAQVEDRAVSSVVRAALKAYLDGGQKGR